MNFYKHHLGDYAQATAHLSFVEDAAYSRLIRKYYADERPIPTDIKAAQRLVGARTREEREAVQAVLDEFFELQEDGWHNKRCDEELADVLVVGDERNAKAENERERQRRHREERKRLFDALRAIGIVPAYDTKTDALRTMLRATPVTHDVTSPVTSHVTPVTRDTSQVVTRTATANQTPDSRLQTPEREEGRAESIPPGVARAPEDAEPERQPTRAGAACLAMRRAGLTSVNPGDPRLIALLEQGATDDELAAMAGEAAAKGKGWGWVLAAVQGRRSEAAAISLAPPPAQTVPSSDAERTRTLLDAEADHRRVVEEQRVARQARKREAA